jgi:hypothetical protein
VGELSFLSIFCASHKRVSGGGCFDDVNGAGPIEEEEGTRPPCNI